jgi:hypothetical protein
MQHLRNAEARVASSRHPTRSLKAAGLAGGNPSAPTIPRAQPAALRAAAAAGFLTAKLFAGMQGDRPLPESQPSALTLRLEEGQSPYFFDS